MLALGALPEFHNNSRQPPLYRIAVTRAQTRCSLAGWEVFEERFSSRTNRVRIEALAIHVRDNTTGLFRPCLVVLPLSTSLGSRWPLDFAGGPFWLSS